MLSSEYQPYAPQGHFLDTSTAILYGIGTTYPGVARSPEIIPVEPDLGNASAGSEGPRKAVSPGEETACFIFAYSNAEEYHRWEDFRCLPWC